MIEITVVAPAHNEEGNVGPLADQVYAALSPLGVGFELVIVDDGSTDSTRARVQDLCLTRPWLRLVAMTRTPPGKGGGQSAAMWAGIAQARGRLVATIDADVQNDPADLVPMYRLLQGSGADFVQGDRSHARKDNLARRYTSVIGRVFRKAFLGDTIRDTGCSLRLLKRQIAVQLPLQLRGMHRFIPITAVHMGYKVVELPVNHRPRTSGTTKYGMGLMRALPGFIDLLAVRYMRNRRRPVDHADLTPATAPERSSPVVVRERGGVPSKPVFQA